MGKGQTGSRRISGGAGDTRQLGSYLTPAARPQHGRTANRNVFPSVRRQFSWLIARAYFKINRVTPPSSGQSSRYIHTDF